MRGDATQQAEMLVPLTPDSFVPADHPIREIKTIVDGTSRSSRSAPASGGGSRLGIGTRRGAPVVRSSAGLP